MRCSVCASGFVECIVSGVPLRYGLLGETRLFLTAWEAVTMFDELNCFSEPSRYLPLLDEF